MGFRRCHLVELTLHTRPTIIALTAVPSQTTRHNPWVLRLVLNGKLYKSRLKACC